MKPGRIDWRSRTFSALSLFKMVVIMVMVMVVVMEDCMRYSNKMKRLDEMMMLMVIMVMIVTTILEQLITLQAILLLKTSKLWPSIVCLVNGNRLHDVVGVAGVVRLDNHHHPHHHHKH